jgi:uncharacterized protein (TIGR03437 family)
VIRYPRLLTNGLLLTCIATTLAGQASSPVTLNFPVTGSGDIQYTTLNLSGSGSFMPYGNAMVSVVVPATSGSTVTVNFVFTFSSGDTLLASTSSATQQPVQGTASFTGGTGLFKGATGYIGFQLSASPGDTPANRKGVLTASGSITLVSSSSASLQVSPAFLQFSAVQGGNTPGPQTITVTAPGTSQAGFTVQLDSGTTGSVSPAWLSVTPTTASTPTVLTVTANQGTLPMSTLTGRVLIVPNDYTQAPIPVNVVFTISTAPPKLTVAPTTLQYFASFGSSTAQEQTLFLRNAGGGTASFTASVVGKSSWITNLAPTSGQTVPNAPAVVKVDVNAQGLAIGFYSDIIRFNSAGTSTDVPVTLTVRPAGPALKLGLTGFVFETVQGNTIADVQPVNVINAGDPGTTVSFTAALLSGSDWLTLTINKNQATTTSPGLLTLQPKANIATFPAGVRTAVLQVTDPNSQNSPELVTAVLQVDAATSAAPPDPSPAGVFLVAKAGQPQPTAPVALNYAKSTPAAYTTSATTMAGGNWLSVTPTSGMVSDAGPANLTLAGNSAGLTTGIYAGSVDIVIGSTLRTLHATLEVLPGVSTTPNPGVRDATTCTPTQLVLVETELVDNFFVVAGFPAFLSVQVNDDCGNPVLDATVIAEFDNGDVPLRMDSDDATGFYSATWTPGQVFQGMNITFDATDPNGLLSPGSLTGLSSKKAAQTPNLIAAAAHLSGTVAANPNPLPVIFPGGTVNNVNPVLEAPLAPGTIASVYGANLATGEAVAPGPPLVTQYQGTSIQTGALAAPLFYVSSDQVDFQVPFELAPNQSYPIVATLNGVSSVPGRFSVAPATPAVVFNPDGTVVAQHGSGSLVTGASPAKPGEPLVIYLVGMGSLTTPVATGQATTGQTTVSITPQVTLNGENVFLFYQGLTPGFVGLYQINLIVPSDAATGTLPLVVTQNGFAANVTQLIVHP